MINCADRQIDTTSTGSGMLGLASWCVSIHATGLGLASHDTSWYLCRFRCRCFSGRETFVSLLQRSMGTSANRSFSSSILDNPSILLLDQTLNRRWIRVDPFQKCSLSRSPDRNSWSQSLTVASPPCRYIPPSRLFSPLSLFEWKFRTTWRVHACPHFEGRVLH